VTLRDALAEILTPAILAERLERRIETEYIIAEGLFRIRQGHRDSPAGKAIIAWCRRHASVWVVEDGDRRLEGADDDAGRRRRLGSATKGRLTPQPALAVRYQQTRRGGWRMDQLLQRCVVAEQQELYRQIADLEADGKPEAAAEIQVVRKHLADLDFVVRRLGDGGIAA
jgi:hypothetical protein